MTRRLAALFRLWWRTLPQAFRFCASMLFAIGVGGVRLLATLARGRLREGRFRPDAPELVRAWRHLARSAVRECAGIIASRLSIGFAIALWGVYAGAGQWLCTLLPDVAEDGHGLAGAPLALQSIQAALDATPQAGRDDGLVFH